MMIPARSAGKSADTMLTISVEETSFRNAFEAYTVRIKCSISRIFAEIRHQHLHLYQADRQFPGDDQHTLRH